MSWAFDEESCPGRLCALLLLVQVARAAGRLRLFPRSRPLFHGVRYRTSDKMESLDLAGFAAHRLSWFPLLHFALCRSFSEQHPNNSEMHCTSSCPRFDKNMLCTLVLAIRPPQPLQQGSLSAILNLSCQQRLPRHASHRWSEAPPLTFGHDAPSRHLFFATSENEALWAENT